MKIASFLSIIFFLMFLTGCQKPADNTPVIVVPASPANLVATVISNTRVNLSWTDKSENEAGFRIERKIAAGVFNVVGTVKADLTTYVDSEVVSNTTYTYRVYAYNSAGSSLTSTNEATVTTDSAIIVNNAPVLTTASITSITATGAVSGGNIISSGSSAITARGVVWSTISNPTIALLTKTTDSVGTGSFTSGLTALNPNTTYYVRAYAINSTDTAYGNEVNFITSASPIILSTYSVDSIAKTSASSGGNITNDGGSSITARGVVWGTSTNPTVALTTKTINGTGTGRFYSSVTGLTPNTTYYLRAYATNSTGTNYGNEISFKTKPIIVLPVVYTTQITFVSITSQNSGGSVTDQGTSAIIAKGVVWSTTINPTIALTTKTTNGTGMGNFTGTITGLMPNTTYYVRAYATNSSGTGYGAVVKIIGWMPRNLEVITYRNGDTIPQVTDPAKWATLTTGAWCYYNNNVSNGVIYGKLYNWYAVSDPRGLAPQGWHIPAVDEWDSYVNSLGNEYYVGGKMKSTNYWASPNTDATNESGFTGLPGGIRNDNGSFSSLTLYGGWHSTQVSGDNVYSRSLSFMYVALTRNYGSKLLGESVRCVKD